MPANPKATIMIVAQAPDISHAQAFEVEYTEFFEYTGVAVVSTTLIAPPDLVMSHSDDVGLDRVLQAAERIPKSLAPAEWVSQMAVGCVDSMAHSDTAARTVEDLMGIAGLSGGTIGGLVKTLVSFLGA